MNGEEKRGRGRPRKYPADIAQDGAPKLTIRMAPELLEWVKEKGGSEYVRQLVARQRDAESRRKAR